MSVRSALTPARGEGRSEQREEGFSDQKNCKFELNCRGSVSGVQQGREGEKSVILSRIKCDGLEF